MKKIKCKALSIIITILFLLIPIISPHVVQAATSGDYTYTVSGGNATITQYTGAGVNVAIPSTVDAYTVTSIGTSAFENCSSLTSITIPKN